MYSTSPVVSAASVCTHGSPAVVVNTASMSSSEVERFRPSQVSATSRLLSLASRKATAYSELHPRPGAFITGPWWLEYRVRWSRSVEPSSWSTAISWVVGTMSRQPSP